MKDLFQKKNKKNLTILKLLNVSKKQLLLLETLWTFWTAFCLNIREASTAHSVIWTWVTHTLSNTLIQEKPHCY